MEKISVIIPVYNVEKYLHQCLDSIVNQTYRNLEIILVDDGSTDNSGNICDEYANKDERIVVIHKENKGQWDARNVGLEKSTGEYIGFVDSDDFIDKDMYENLIKQIKNYNADLVMCRLMDCYGKIPKKDNNVEIKLLNQDEAIKIVMEAKITSITVVNKLYKRSLFENLRFKNIPTAEDAYIMIYILMKSTKIVLDMSQRYYYMHREGSTTTNKFNPDTGYNPIKVYENYLSIIKEKYPALIDVAETRVIWANFIVLDRMINSNVKPDREIIKFLRKNFIKILTNDSFTFERKISAIALKINIKLYQLCVKQATINQKKLFK